MEIASKQKATYFISSHGIDIGKIFNLPRDVRVLMICETGTYCSAGNTEEAKFWSACLKEDTNDEYMKELDKYCIYSGNTTTYNRIPDLILSYEPSSFFSGVFKTPFDLNVIITKSRCSEGERKGFSVKEFGEITKLDSLHVIDLLQKVKQKGEIKFNNLADTEFIEYFLRPAKQKNKKIDELLFLLLPNVKTFYSLYNVSEIIGNTKICTSVEPFDKYVDTYRIDKIKLDDFTIEPGTVVNDIPRIVSEEEKESINKEIDKNNDLYKGNNIYLSDVIRYLCNIESNKLVTVVVSACRGFPKYGKTIVLESYKKDYPDWYAFIGRPERKGMVITEYKTNIGLNNELKKNYLYGQEGGRYFDHNDDDDNDYQQKYLKYKAKYLKLKA